jgi:hypothetical protein
MATYPSGTNPGFVHKVNTVDIVDATDINNMMDEITIIEQTVGANPAVGSNATSSSTYTAPVSTFGTVAARLNNIEAGVVADTHTQYIRKTSDNSNVITTPNTTTKGLTIKGVTGQSVVLQDWQNNSGSTLASVDQNGNLAAASFVKSGGTSSQFLKADGSVDSNSYQPFTVNTTAKTSAYTLTTSDSGTMVQMNGAYAFSINNSLSSLPAGTQIHLLALTSGVSVTGAGVTLNGTPGLKLRTAYSSATLICLGTNNWVLVGDLSA